MPFELNNQPPTMSSSKDAGKQQLVDLSSLSAQNLSSVKQQLDEELQHLTDSFAKLRTAQSKFQECIKTIQTGVSPDVEGKTILIPLTSSLYVPGSLTSVDTVIVDIGTGYYIEKSTTDAQAFYKNKVDSIQQNIIDLEKIITQKSQNVRIVEEVLRQKMLGGVGGSGAAAGSSA
ncbi:Prefoldin alpha subunit [Terfezia boudieri ATCC MYA-4762]|uniref:Prefoldin alpha subunit n=1 Tax=Terfezia boudieri ATCC MYA-4762 TaxID=1051890 RepID=A0A3N4LS57_9PEZI|nr:Prefoldin alpha subunit [Terfezia boudieri ATCC MYA-4762]